MIDWYEITVSALTVALTAVSLYWWISGMKKAESELQVRREASIQKEILRYEEYMKPLIIQKEVTLGSKSETNGHLSPSNGKAVTIPA